LGNPVAVRVGPGILKIAPLASTEPTDLLTPWDTAWTDLGYTDDGSNFVFEQNFEDVMVEEEYEPVQVLQTTRQITINFALAELTAENLSRAFNGGTVDTTAGLTTFEPPAAGQVTRAMIGWESDDGLERWIFRTCTQIGSVDIPRKKAPDKAMLPMSFRATKPAGVPAFVFMYSADYAELGS
jgi:hypothetical protein